MEGCDVCRRNDSKDDQNVTFVQSFNDSSYSNEIPPTELFLSLMEFTKWAILIVISFGFAGNCVSFYIFTKSSLKKLSSSRYLSAIAFVDMGCLLSTLCTHLLQLNINMLYVNGICPLVTYINFICTFLSIWYVTALVCEKFIGLYFPTKKARYCTVFRAKCVIIAFAVLAVVCYHYITWTVGYTSMLCLPWPENELNETYEKLSKVDEIVVSVIPYLIILILSCLIAIKMWNSYKRKRSTGFRLHRRQTAFVPQDKEYKTSGLVLLVSIVTFCLGITYSIFRVFKIMNPQEMMTISQFLQINSYAIKPYMYLLASRPYRKYIWKFVIPIISCNRWLQNASSSEMQDVSQQSDSGRAIEIIMEKSI